MKTLSPEHRRQLERAIADARDIAETGARAALEALAVDQRDPFGHMSDEQRTLRRRLRAHARHVGDRVEGRSGEHGIDHLTQECAYEHWHAMLFARFLAENALLIHPELEVDVTLEQCEELAKAEGTDRWALASRFAQRMLPQVFRPDHPVFGVRLAREHRVRLEELVEGLATEIFTASDALGWVYQFWQARKKDEVNRSEVKIGAAELPAVTQLFTEPYMVEFLLHNSLGAWWDSRHPDKPCPADVTYLRHSDDGQPAAGTFGGWPDDLSEFRLLDPCCGSGHFLVAALLMLVPMRMALEGLAPSAAVDAVLGENLHGLEIDQRCVAIAAFALALAAWRYPDAGGYRKLPRLSIAWCGQPVAASKDEWLGLAAGDPKVEAGMAALHDAFRDAPTLGSLIDPVRSAPEDMLMAGFDQLRPLLAQVLEGHNEDADREETAIAALGTAEAAKLLSREYYLVVTNVPYLTRGKQGTRLSRFCSDRYPDSKQDLATAFLRRCLEMVAPGGTVSLVMPQNWLFLKAYALLRTSLLVAVEWSMLVKLGPAAFSDMNWWAINTCLATFKRSMPSPR
ncbi:MAG: N-6 DNA methylase, partial [Rhodospirillales bacterium]|nr:N-6 DNA methylase [Rhodospirillales bacterium]